MLQCNGGLAMKPARPFLMPTDHCLLALPPPNSPSVAVLAAARHRSLRKIAMALRSFLFLALVAAVAASAGHGVHHLTTGSFPEAVGDGKVRRLACSLCARSLGWPPTHRHPRLGSCTVVLGGITRGTQRRPFPCPAAHAPPQPRPPAAHLQHRSSRPRAAGVLCQVSGVATWQ